jgi:hypothetical protein
MLDAGASGAAGQVLATFGEVSVCAVFDWANHLGGADQREVPAGWRHALNQSGEVILEWLSRRLHDVKAPSAAVAAEILDPHSRNVHTLGADVWLRALAEAGNLPQTSRIRLCAFALALGLDGAVVRADALAVATFETVHEAIAAGHLEYQTWLLFENHVPVLSAWRNWDKCERLRRGLVDSWERHLLPLEKFLRCPGRAESFRSLLETCDDYKNGRNLLNRMRMDKDRLATYVPDDCMRIFRYYVH